MDATHFPFDNRQIESILAADIGSCWTRVILLDRVEGQYRFIARSDLPTTSEPPAANVAAALRLACREIEESAGRQLVDGDGTLISPERSDGSGVDLFVVTCSAARPLDVAIAGLAEEFSVAGARAAARATYSRITDTFALDSARGRWGSPRGILGVVEALYASRPQAVLVAGGTDGGAEAPLLELAEALALAGSTLPLPERPRIVFAGNPAVAQRIEEVLDGTVEYSITENLQPAISRVRSAPASLLLDELYRDRRLQRVPGIGTVQQWSELPILPTIEAWSRVVQFLALQNNTRVLGVDLGAANSAVVAAFPGQGVHTVVRTDLGTDGGLEGVLAHASPPDLFGWVPGDTEPAVLADLLATYRLRPGMRPETVETLSLLQAAGREALRLLVADAQPTWPSSALATHDGRTWPAFDQIILGGGVLREAPDPVQAVLIALDGLQPAGVSHLLRDRIGLVPAIGALADAAPDVGVSLLAGPILESLGTAIVPVGGARRGDVVLRFRMTLPDGSGYDVNVEHGRLYREWLPPGQSTKLTLQPARGIDVGAGPGRPMELVVRGGSAGLIVDARGRPLPLDDDLLARRARVEEWYRDVGA